MDARDWDIAKIKAQVGYAECKDTIANRRIVSITLGFYKNRLGDISIVFDEKDFSAVKDGLTEKYGKPFRIDTAQLNIKFTGAPSSFISITWKNKNGHLLTVQNHEQDGSAFHEKGLLLIKSPEFHQQFEEESKASGIVPASKDI